MQTVRRLYLYLMSGITLGVMLVGLNNLFVVVFHAIGLGRGPFGDSGGADREALSLSFALIVVGGVVWTIHWLLIERSLHGAGVAGAAERTSPIRALYLSVVLSVVMAFGVLAGIQLLQHLARLALQVPRPDQFDFLQIDVGAATASVLVMGMAWAYHVVIRRRDLHGREMVGAAAWLPRVYLYGAALLGLILAMVNISSLLEQGIRGLLGTPVPPDSFDPGSGTRQVADTLAGMLGWTVIWAGHWLYATSLTHSDGWRGHSERRSRLRVAYLLAAIAAGAIATVVLVSQSATSVLQILLGMDSTFRSETRAEAIVGPLLSALPWLAAWWLHAWWLAREGARSDVSHRRANVGRLASATVGLIGLAATGLGLSILLATLLTIALGDRQNIFVRDQLAMGLAVGLLGAALWLWSWLGLQQRRAAEPAAEAASTVRRAYLLLAFGASLLAVVGSVAFLLFQVFNTLLGVVTFDDRASVIANALGVLLTAGASAVYHGLQELADRRLRASTTTAEEAPPPPQAVRRSLTLSASSAEQLDQGVAALRAVLPPGVSLDDEG